MNKQQVQNLVIECVNEIGLEDNKPELSRARSSTPLYGPNGTLDSLGLVRLITNIEEKISELLHKDIVIASEKAMSQKNSPFLNVDSLSTFILELLNADHHV